MNKSESRLRIYATPARDAALTVPPAATSASFDLPIMVFLPLKGDQGHHALVRHLAGKITAGLFYSGIFEWTVHEDETVKPAVSKGDKFRLFTALA
jgi:hypothetical protein